MDWRLTMLSICGPGVLCGIKLPDWLRLLRENGRRVDLSRLPRVASITLQSLKNSAFGFLEDRRYERLLEKVTIQPPLFVLGHWRSGTTHLHELITQDSRFAFPNSYQTSFPAIFLSSEAADSRLLSFFIPRRRPMDNMGLTLASPQEDEFALCASCLRSPCMSWVFPSQKERFNRYLTFKGVAASEVDEWKKALVQFVKKVQWRNGRPLILKSPPHTARIRLLLEMFPEAKFVHIHRNPFRVFQSSKALFVTMFRWHGLQRADLAGLDDWILSQYREMYEAFFEQRELVPEGRFHEVSFEQLEQDPVGEVRKMYEALELPDFSDVEAKLRRYAGSLAGYQKNTFADLPSLIKKRIAAQWAESFESWGYPQLT